VTVAGRTAARPSVAGAERVVIKVGTRVVTHDDGRLALARVSRVVETLARLRRSGRPVVLVSSGAVGLGCDALGIEGTPRDLATRQACAAIGQGRLVALYEQGLSRLGALGAQVLLTRADFDDRTRYLNLRRAFEALLTRGVVPIVNENDVVATEELAFPGNGGGCGAGARTTFGDNDRLSALVAAKLSADLLVLLTDVDGVYAEAPGAGGAEAPLPRLSIDALDGVACGAGASAGRGGMQAKLEAARIAARAGCDVVVASGRDARALDRVLAGEEVGTWIEARRGLDARRRGIAFAADPRGALHVDAGAVCALSERGASLLAAGVVRVEGDFKAGDVVDIFDPGGEPVARGVVGVDAPTAVAWAAGSAPEGARTRDALVPRDQMVVELPPSGPPAPGGVA